VKRLSEDERRTLNKSDPIVSGFLSDISDLKIKVARLEERQNNLERTVEYLKQKIEGIDSKVWYILSGVIVSIILQILLRMMH
jgi:archaellum component FlaC